MSTLDQFLVCHRRPEADPEWTQRGNLEFGWSLLYVMLGLFGIVPIDVS